MNPFLCRPGRRTPSEPPTILTPPLTPPERAPPVAPAAPVAGAPLEAALCSNAGAFMLFASPTLGGMDATVLLGPEALAAPCA